MKTEGLEGSKTDIEVRALITKESRQGAVELLVPGERAYLTLSEARAVAAALSQQAAAAETDTFLLDFFTSAVEEGGPGVSDDHVFGLIARYRQWRALLQEQPISARGANAPDGGGDRGELQSPATAPAHGH